MSIDHINPSIKAGTILLSVLLLSFSYNTRLNFIIFLLCMFLLLFCSKTKKKRIVLLLFPACIAAFGMFVMGLYYAKEGSLTSADMDSISNLPFMVRAAMSTNLNSALQLSTRLLSFAGMGIMFTLSTDGTEFVLSLMHQCHVPPKFAYGILAAVHMMPNMVKEYKQVKLAYRVRGKKWSMFAIAPVFTMLVNSIHWSESMAMAMESKGFTGEWDRTFYRKTNVSWKDYAFAIVFVVLILVGMYYL